MPLYVNDIVQHFKGEKTWGHQDGFANNFKFVTFLNRGVKLLQILTRKGHYKGTATVKKLGDFKKNLLKKTREIHG